MHIFESHPACGIEAFLVWIWIFLFIDHVFYLWIIGNERSTIHAPCPVATILAESDVAELVGGLLLWLRWLAVLWLLKVLKDLLVDLEQRLNISWRQKVRVRSQVNRRRLATRHTSVFVHIMILNLTIIAAFLIYSECLLLYVWQQRRPTVLLWLVKGPTLWYSTIILKEDVGLLIDL